MAIDALNKLSNEQLMAMSMSGNGQITNDSGSSTENDMNYAFALMMKDLVESSKNSKKDVKAVSDDNVSKTQEKDNEAKIENQSSDAEKAEEVDGNIVRAVQTYATGQKLQDIPMVVNNRYINLSGKTNPVSYTGNDGDMENIYSAVNSAAQKYGVDPNLILAIIKQESDFNPNSTSGVGASGLMQIMPSNFSSLGITDQYDIAQNVDGGTKLLKDYLNQYNGSIEMALMAYNGGPGTMQKRGVSSSDDLYKMPKETQNYVPKVIGYYRDGV